MVSGAKISAPIAVARAAGFLSKRLDRNRASSNANIADISAKFTKGLDNATIASTCSDYVSVGDDVSIVPGSGTGVYKGITGTFYGILTVNELHPRPCIPNSLLFRQLIWMNLAGTVTTTPKA